MTARLPLLALALALVATQTGWTFHLKLLRAEPGADTTLTEPPAEVRLWFSQPVEPRATSIKLTDDAGTTHELAPISVGSDKGAVSAPVGRTLGAGRYTVAWRTMARDGHVVRGEIGFAVAGTSAGR